MKFKASLYFTVMCIILLNVSLLHAEETNPDQFSIQEKIKIYRQIIKQEKDPYILAEAHFKIAGFLETLERDTESTAEYLKVILNYSGVGEFSSKAEKRLASLYNKFSDRETSYLETGISHEQAKDPAIFFTYIKSLYGTYVDKGEYQRAVYLLERLIKMDGSNPVYYGDLGNVYLNGYNDPDKALVYFEKLTEIDPENTKVLADMALAYEKKGDIEKAVEYYRKAIDLAPFSSWSVYGLSRLNAINIAKEGRLIKNWRFLGAFDNSDGQALTRVIGPEEKIEPDNDIKIDGKNISWIKPFSFEDYGYVDLKGLFDKNDEAAAFALTYVYTEEDKNVQIRMGCEVPFCVWINNEKVFLKKSILRPARLDDDIFQIKLEKGWNSILIKTAQTHGRWGFYFRITDDDGNTPLDIIFDPDRDTERAKKVYYGLKKQKRLKIARATVLSGSAVFFLVFGIYLVISNIHNKFKIRQMKDDFIASVSHELKTPLAAIKMFTETLSMGRVKGEDKIQEYYSTIVRESDRLTRFINKILDFQKIEKGKKIYSFEKVNINEVLKSAVDIYRAQVQDDDLVVEEEYGGDLPLVEIDEDALLQVFINLLTNAYKYSVEEKYMKVRSEHIGDTVIISLTDKGIGISKDKITKVFDKFYRVDRDSTKAIKGSGIGLAFVKSVIEAHGGRIAVESQINKGSTFKVSLPLKPVQ